MNFNTDQNKKILWDLLSDNKYFDNLPIEVMKNMPQIFEAQIVNILEYNKNKSLKLLNLNQLFIKSMVDEISKYQVQDKKKVTFNENTTEMYTREDIRNQKVKNIETVYEKKKDEFNNSYIEQQPQDVDLSDKTNKNEFNDNVNKSYDSTLAQREKELEEIRKGFDSQIDDKAKNWITPKQTMKEKLKSHFADSKKDESINDQQETSKTEEIPTTSLPTNLLELLQNLQKEITEIKNTQEEMRREIDNIKNK